MIHPKYGKPLNGKPHTWDGVAFRAYRSGIMRYVWVSDDYRAEIVVPDPRYSTTYPVYVDGKFIGRFRFRHTAAEAAVKALRATSVECRH